ncbi:synaptonemal complex protein 1 isoform X1 [Vigna radiata var. radiata]|uniref:Synaptonemal complex protein 1 isoform X1 n=1 Tax=Vigna radiata var. radiata TaxID=3916 RepID=A0A3Q0F5H5_VIGRR|nr:synaptonemal complex protein 1 isoform X1 [Vigna radiata var. radiata]
MQKKLAFPVSKSLDQFKSLYGSISGASKPLSSRPSVDTVSSGSFANLKLTAEKLVKEQASAKTDLENANAKLKKSQECVRALEEKLQNALNENAKLQVKQKEDEKLWKGLESKFSSTKTLCDQLTETLQKLAGLVQDAEKDKETLENKLSASSKTLDSLSKQMDGLSLKLDSAQETIRTRDNELEKLKFASEEKEKFHRDEHCRVANVIEEKDNMIRNLEEILASSRLATENLNSTLEEVHVQLKVKEDEIMRHITSQEKLEKEKSDLQLLNAGLAEKHEMSLQEIENLKETLQSLAADLSNLDKESLNLLSKFDEMNLLYASCFQLVQKERETFSKHAQYQYSELNNKFVVLELEKNATQMKNYELNKTVDELRKVQESTVAQLTEDSRLAAERIQSLVSETETLVSKKKEAEVLISKLEEKVELLLESSRSSDNHVQDLLLKVSALETESKENTERLQAEILKKSEEIDTLQKERIKLEKHADSLGQEVIQLHNALEEKEQCVLHCKEQEKKLQDQITENTSLLTAVESKLSEARKQYDQMVENKQLELSRHLKEISQRNDQAINDIKRKYELEKMEIVNMEKDKTDKTIAEIEGRCDKKIAECNEESRQQLMRIQEENTLLVNQMQQEHDKKQLSLISEHNEQLKRTQLLAENELREKTIFMRNDHEAQIKALRCELEDECRKLEEELHLQKSKEDRQRALLQLQWKVMSDKPKEDQEVNSKQDYSISSIKRRSSCGGKRNLQRGLDSPYFEATQTPVPKLLTKVDNIKTGSAVSIPKRHRKQVTRHEYEVETSNGRTITKKRKTRSTVMFEDPRNRKINTPKVNTPGSVVKSIKGGGHTNPSNIGDLFSEGSLNPYADDPYAFD